MNMLLGSAGAGIDFTKIKLPFSATDLLSSGVEIMGVFGSFILLALGLVFAPKLISLVYSAIRGARKA